MTRTEILADYKKFFEMEHLMITDYDELMIDWAEQLVKKCNISHVGGSASDEKHYCSCCGKSSCSGECD